MPRAEKVADDAEAEEDDEEEEKGRDVVTSACTNDSEAMATTQPPITLDKLPPKTDLTMGSRKKPLTTALRKDMADMDRPMPASSRPKVFFKMSGRAEEKMALAKPVETFVPNKSHTAPITETMDPIVEFLLDNTLAFVGLLLPWGFWVDEEEEDEEGRNRHRNTDSSDPATAILAEK